MCPISTGVKQCAFRWLISDDIALKEMALDSSIIHHLIMMHASAMKLYLIHFYQNWLILKFHPEKCVMMSMGKNSASNKDKHTYTMEGHNLNYSSCEKDLGVYIDEDLSFDIHISQAINKANRVMAIARKTFDFMNEDIFLNIFKGLVRPHLKYATAVWSPPLNKTYRWPRKCSTQSY